MFSNILVYLHFAREFTNYLSATINSIRRDGPMDYCVWVSKVTLTDEFKNKQFFYRYYCRIGIVKII